MNGAQGLHAFSRRNMIPVKEARSIRSQTAGMGTVKVGAFVTARFGAVAAVAFLVTHACTPNPPPPHATN